MKAQEKVIAEIESDIQQTVKRRRYAYASEHAGWLGHASKLLLKVVDEETRVALFLKIVLRAVKLLQVVDDSGGALQSVVHEGSYCFELWQKICKTSDIIVLKSILKKVLPGDEYGIADSLFFPNSALPLPGSSLLELKRYVLDEIKYKNESRRTSVALGCLSWLAQLKDEASFGNLVAEFRINDRDSWHSRFNLYLNLGKYQEATNLAKSSSWGDRSFERRFIYQVCERSQDRNLLMQTALSAIDGFLSVDEFKRIKSLLTNEELSSFISNLLSSEEGNEGFNVAFCEILFTAGELKTLHEYAVNRYDDVFYVGRCTGMAPLGKKLAAAGDPLVGCIFLRGVIYYLMNRCNSKYYADVHRCRKTLDEIAQSVNDWETVETQEDFDSRFICDFSGRKAFGL